MAEREVTVNDVKAVKPEVTDAEPPVEPLVEPLAEPPTNEQTSEPLDLIESPKARTKLRIYAILISLYVNYSSLTLSKSPIT